MKYHRRDCKIEKKIRKKNIRWIQIWHVEYSLWIGKLKQKRKLFGLMISMSTLWIPREHLKIFSWNCLYSSCTTAIFHTIQSLGVFQSGHSIVKNWLEFIFIEFSNGYEYWFLYCSYEHLCSLLSILQPLKSVDNIKYVMKFITRSWCWIDILYNIVEHGRSIYYLVVHFLNQHRIHLCTYHRS